MNRMQKGIISAGAMIFGGLSVAAFAHHGWSGYETEIRKVSGTIEEASYSNPHASIRLKTPEKTWVVVLAPPSRMSSRGLTAESLKVGATASVEGYQHSSDKNEMRAERITLDGKTVELR
jgi:Family of unknown function (DUF6152)